MASIEPSPGETLELLVGNWHLLQLERGHRFSADDMLCAWAALSARPAATRLLDLGAGIGSVGLMTLWHLPPEARLVMVEVQQVSHLLACRSLARNGIEARVEARLGDLRDPASVPERAAFDLITCSPPYIPEHAGVASPVPQRAGARLELRGNIFDYLRTASRALAPGGRVSVVFAASDPRPAQAVVDAGLSVDWSREVYFRAGRPASLVLFVAGHAREQRQPPTQLPPLILRDEQGERTQDYLAVREDLGFAR